MSKFTDAAGGEWTIEFDCFLLDRVRKEAEVDVANFSADGLLAVERDVAALGRVLAVACDEQWKSRGKTAREFLNGIRGDALARAREAVLAALADFFPAKEWSAMLSSLQTRKSQPEMTPEQLQLAAGFLRMDPEVQRDVMHLIQQEQIAGNSLLSPGGESASLPDATPLSPAADSPASAE
jgi:hypothetical protein